ncbi:hypothetical protein T4D_8341 [Trichinella pseudospiralis]|uniref:Uncharacterized protein n=1 Tax=Trichinella pseudospiralis TaxID=6337 RepID=A0A0V1FLF2_TRIPS|nr:hypothetical protein T4D_8341 [Trichinella pseudospiralis]
MSRMQMTRDRHCMHMRKHVTDCNLMHGDYMQNEKAIPSMDKMYVSIGRMRRNKSPMLRYFLLMTAM